MKTTVNVHTFREAFKRMGRGDQFTYEGLEVHWSPRPMRLNASRNV